MFFCFLISPPVVFSSTPSVSRSRKTRLRGGRVDATVAGLAIALLLSVLPGFAQETSDEPPAPDRKFTLSGTVVNSLTGEPIRRAMVEIFVGGEKGALTDAAGHFEFSGLPGGTTAVRAHKPGFFSEQDRGRGEFIEPPLVSVGPEAQPVVVKLLPEGVIAGRILSEGEPVENIPVSLMTVRMREGRRQVEQRGNASSDEDGEFRIANLLPGTYYLVFGPSWRGNAPLGSKEVRESGYREIFYQSGESVESATPLVVGAGQRIVADVSVKLEPWYHIRGVVRNAEGFRAVNVFLLEAGERPRGRSTRFNPATGEFELRAPAGQYMLHATGYAENAVAGVAYQPLTVKGDAEGLSLVLNPPVTIPVTLQLESSGARKRENDVVFGRNGQGATIFLRNETSNSVAYAVRDDVKKPESLTLHNVEPGTYWADIRANGTWYVKSAQCGDVDLLREKLTVGSSAPCPAIEVALRNDGATLKVSATVEEGVAATVLLMPERAPHEARAFRLVGGGYSEGIALAGGYNVFSDSTLPASGAASGSRSEEFTNLAPGDYRVLLLDDTAELEYTNPDAMTEYMSKGSHVTLEAGQAASVNLELVRVKK